MSPSISVAGSPSAMPNGIITVSVAAWLFTKADTQNMAKDQGASCTMVLILVMRKGLLAVTKVSLIQAMPKIDTTAIMPAVKTWDLAMSDALTLVEKRMNAPKPSITICTTVVMGTGLPSTSGRICGR